MPAPPDEIRLRHMRDAARDALSFVEGRTKEQAASDRQLTLALIKSLEMVGEAASKVSEDTRITHPSIPWSKIIGMRNRLVHVYFNIDFDQVWTTVETELPQLVKQLDEAISDFE